MKARTILGLASIGSSLYLLSRDKELRRKLTSMIPADKTEGLSQKVDEVISKAYERLCIAHTREISRLQEEIDDLKRELRSSNRDVAHEGPATE